MMGVALEEDKIREHSLVKGHPWAGRGVDKKPRKKEKKRNTFVQYLVEPKFQQSQKV